MLNLSIVQPAPTAQGKQQSLFFSIILPPPPFDKPSPKFFTTFSHTVKNRESCFFTFLPVLCFIIERACYARRLAKPAHLKIVPIFKCLDYTVSASWFSPADRRFCTEPGKHKLPPFSGGSLYSGAVFLRYGTGCCLALKETDRAMVFISWDFPS